MLKKFSKLLLLMLLIFFISVSPLVCSANEIGEISNTVTSTQTSENTSTTPETYKGNLYLFGIDIVMDKYVDGDVFILGNNVDVTGQVNGNLYVLAKNVSFNKSVIRYSIFACADFIYYNGGTYEGDFYSIAKNLEMTYDSYVTGNLKVVGSDVILKAAIAQNVDLLCNTLDLGEGTDIPIIYGDLNYSTSEEITIPGNSLLGTANYTPYALTLLTFILFSFSTCIITSIVIYIIIKKCTTLNFSEKLFNTKLSAIKLLKSFGIGLAFILVISILFAILLITRIGILLALILAALFIVIVLTAIPTLTICITNSLKNLLKAEKNYIFYIILSLVNIILFALILLPGLFIGILGIIISLIISFIILITAIGLIVITLKPCKKNSEEKKEEIDSL